MILIGSDSAPSAGKLKLHVDIPSVPAYQHLRLVLEGRSDDAHWDVSWGLQINGDALCYYDWQQLRANYNSIIASAGGVGSEVRAGLGTIPAGPALALCSGCFIADLPNYRDAIWGQHVLATGSEVWNTPEGAAAVMQNAGFYAKQAAVTSLDAIVDLGKWVYGSSLHIYGWG